jgi:hypothetical protein
LEYLLQLFQPLALLLLPPAQVVQVLVLPYEPAQVQAQGPFPA